MADPTVAALIAQLEGMGALLAGTPGGIGAEGVQTINQLVLDLRAAEAQGMSAAERAKFLGRVQAVADGIPKITQGAIGLANAVKSGDPYAIAASSLELAGSLAVTVGSVAGPEGAAAGALLAAVLSMVSMILKLFTKEPPSLLSQIENLMRGLEAEKKLQGLAAARSAIKVFNTQARNLKEGQKISFSVLVRDFNFNLIEGNTIVDIRKAREWLKEPANQDLPLWANALAMKCQITIDLKLSIIQWLPHMLDSPEESGTKRLIDQFTLEDDQERDFLAAITPAARNRGTLWLLGFDRRLHIRDVVSSANAEWTYLDDFPSRGMTAARVGGSAGETASPYLAVFGIGQGDDDWQSHGSSESNLNHPFITTYDVWGVFGRWPLKTDSSGGVSMGNEWRTKPCYDIWAIRGRSDYQVQVYTAEGDKLAGYIGEYSEAAAKAGTVLRPVWQHALPSGYKVGAVRAVLDPKPFPDEDPHALDTPLTQVVYGACEVALGSSVFCPPLNIPAAGLVEIPSFLSGVMSRPYNHEHMEIRVLHFHAEGNGKSFTESTFLTPWDNIVGMGVDSKYLWVFRSGEIACVTHSSVGRCSAEGAKQPPWMQYKIPYAVGNYDPNKPFAPPPALPLGAMVYNNRMLGLYDLSPCDDGTLVAAYVPSDDWQSGLRPVIYSMTPRIDRKTGTLVIEGSGHDHGGHPVPNHGWVKAAGSANAHRIHKQPIFCWPMLETLERTLTGKPS